MTYLFTSPDNIPYPEPGTKIADTSSSENLTNLLQQQAVVTQVALSAINGSAIKIRGNADGMNLNTMFLPSQHFGLWEITSFGGATPLPVGFEVRGLLEIYGGTQFSVVQTLTGRDQNTTWTRTCFDSESATPVWSPWKSDRGAQPAADGRDLNTMFELVDFGIHEIIYSGGAKNMPAGFYGKGTLEINGGTKFTVTQTLMCREQATTWQRVGQDTSASTPLWSDWVVLSQPAISNATQVAIGDSLGNLIGSNVGSTMPGVDVRGRGWNGETTDGINTRIGAKRTIWTVAGGSIPASGSVTITTNMRLDLTASSTFYTGHLNGVAGKIEWNATDGSFLFTRDASGSAVPSSGKVLFEPRWTAQVQFMTFVITMGRNDMSLDSLGFDADTVTHIKANYRELTDWITAERKRFCVLGTLNRTNEPRGHKNHTRVLELEEWMKNEYPGHFLPWRRYIIDQVIYDLGITPTAEDLANMANDCPPPSVMTDITHPTPEAATKTWEKLIRPWQLAKGWI